MMHRLLHRSIHPVLLLPLLIGVFYLAYSHLPAWEAAMLSMIMGGMFWLVVQLCEWLSARLYRHVERRVDRYLERCALAARGAGAAPGGARKD